MSKYGELLEQLVVRMAEEFTKQGSNPEAARALAEIGMDAIREEVGGCCVYFSKGHFYRISEQHKTIYNRFTGNNHAVLAKEFNLSERQIYTIVEKVGLEIFDKKQIKLFA